MFLCYLLMICVKILNVQITQHKYSIDMVFPKNYNQLILMSSPEFNKYKTCALGNYRFNKIQLYQKIDEIPIK